MHNTKKELIEQLNIIENRRNNIAVLRINKKEPTKEELDAFKQGIYFYWNAIQQFKNLFTQQEFDQIKERLNNLKKYTGTYRNFLYLSNN